MEVIAGFLAIIDKLIQWIEIGEKKQEVIFTRFVEDLYSKFQPVALDYITLFETLGESASRAGSTAEFDHAFHEFEKERLQFEGARRQIEVLAGRYGRGIGDDDIKALFVDMQYFFYDEGTAGSMSRSMRETFHQLIKRRDEIARQRLETLSQSSARRFGPSAYGASPGPVAGPFGVPGSDYFAAIHDRAESEARDYKCELLDDEERTNRATCVREAQSRTVLCKDRWKAINQQYADLRVKYLLG